MGVKVESGWFGLCRVNVTANLAQPVRFYLVESRWFPPGREGCGLNL